MSDHEKYADLMIRDAMMSVSGGLDVEMASEAVNEALKALKLQAAAMAKKALTLESDDTATVLIISKAMNNTARVIDDITRLMAFADRGGRDGRDLGADLLASLTDEQLRLVREMVASNAARG